VPTDSERAVEDEGTDAPADAASTESDDADVEHYHLRIVKDLEHRLD